MSSYEDQSRYHVKLYYKKTNKRSLHSSRSTPADTIQEASQIVEEAKKSGLFKRAIIRERVLDTTEGFV